MAVKSIVILLPAAWLSCQEAARGQIPPGFELVQITFDDGYERYADINDCGQVVFTKKLGASYQYAEIFLYDNGRTRQMTDNSLIDILPFINNHGTLVWSRGDSGMLTQVMTWSGEAETLLFEDSLSAWTSAIDDRDQVLWTRFTGDGCGGADADVYLFSDGNNRQLTYGGASNQAGHMSDDGHIVFTRYDFCQQPWHGDIVYFHDERYDVISSDQSFAQVPDINRSHQIVWESGGGVDYLWIWKDGEREFFNDDGAVPRINNLGNVTFWRSFEDTNEVHAMLSHEGQVFQLTSGPAEFYPNGINNHGEIVIRRDDRAITADVFLLRRVRTGDYSLDNRIDLLDYEAFAECMTVPDWRADRDLVPTRTLCECRFLDLDYDGDVDLKDFGLFQSRFSE